MMDVARHARGFWFVFALYVRQSLYHKMAAIGTVMTWAVRMGLTILLYHYIYQLIDDKQAKGVTFSIAVSGMLYFAVFFGFGTRQISRAINKEYKSGGLEVWFNKPLPYLITKSAETLGHNILASLCLFMAFTGASLAIAHRIGLDHVVLRFGLLTLFLLLGLAIAVLLYAIIGLSALFLGSTNSMENIVSKFVMIFGGAYIPIGFFPQGFRMVGEWLPTSAMTYGGQFFYADFLGHAPRFFIAQIMWIAVLAVCVIRLYRKAAGHLRVNGG